MDTIIYFHKKRGLKEPVTEPIGMKDHLLIRVAMDVDREEWFGAKLGLPARQEERAAPRLTMPTPKGGYAMPASEGGFAIEKSFLRTICHPLRALRQLHARGVMLRQERQRRQTEERERERLLTEREAQLTGTEEAIQKLVHEILELTGEQQSCFCVYEDSIRRGLVGAGEMGVEMGAREVGAEMGALPGLWQRNFQIPDFNNYQQQFWVEQLLPQAVLPHFVILGTADCVFEVIEKCARRMKSLRWLLLEADCSPELTEFVEDFYTEYGLAIALQSLPDVGAMRRMRLVCREPANILDFTGDSRIPVTEVAKGSVWLDMLSVEEKQRRIQGRSTGINYVSMKEKWKRAQKRCISPVLP